ncbi:MAG: LamG domain-containing protein, partial [Phycisphaerae bacterium]
MCKKLVYLVSFALVLSLAGNASSGLVAHWRLDEGSDTTVYDSSGNNYHGTLNGNPSWVAGKIGGALELDGDGDYVDFGNPADLPSGKAERSICGWGKTDIVSSGYRWIAAYGTPTTSQAFFIGLNGTTIVGGGYGGDDVLHSDFWEVDVWHHICLTYDGAIARLYADGVEVASTTKNWNLILSRAFIGEQVNNASELWDGVVDDIRIYDHVLSENEVKAAMVGEGYPYAYGPTPEDGALHEDTWISLSWRAGDFTVSHDVYLGDNFEDVNAGAESTFLGNQDITNLVAGFPGFAYPDGLVPGTTYYWRIDEVNDTEPNSPWKGNVWSFSIPPKTAYYPDPADAAEQVDPDANLSWTPGFGAKLHTVYFGDNFDEVDSATGGLPQGVATYDPGTLKLAQTYYWRVDEFDAIETYKGDVWSFTTEGAVGNPDPANGAVDVKQTQIITFSPSVFAASHELYFGTDKDAVKNADTGSPEYKGTSDLGSESYDPGKLEWDTTYYWRIDEVNNANPNSPWTGNVRSFTTANFLVVDDFES